MNNKTVVCEDTGATFSAAMNLAHTLNVYETSVLNHLKGKTPLLMGKKYKYQ